MTPAAKRKERFLERIDALLQRLEDVPRMDIRDYIAALTLVDRVVAREKTDDNAERAGSKVREYAPSFAKTANGSRAVGGGTGASAPEYDDDEPDDESDGSAPEDGDADDERDESDVR